MPLAYATSTDQLSESSSLPSVIEGVITSVPCAPLDFGSLFTGKWKEDRWLPFNLGAYIHITPDEGEPIIVPIAMTSFGGLKDYIVASAYKEELIEARSSDIDYPGNPEHPHGMDMDAMTEALEDLWNSKGVDGNVKLYHQALIDTYGGEQPFQIGRDPLPKRTDWEFFLTQMEKLTNWKEAVTERMEKGDMQSCRDLLGNLAPTNPHQLLKGFRGTLERVEIPSIGKPSAMKDTSKRAWKIHVPTAFVEYVDVSKVVTTRPAGESTDKPTPSDDNHASAYADALIEALEDTDDGTLDSTGIRTVALGFSKETKDLSDLRKFAIKHRTDEGFLISIDGTEWDGANLTLA